MVLISILMVWSGPDKLEAVLDRAWQFQLAFQPVFATSVGDHRFDDRLTDLSPERIQLAEKECFQIRKELMGFKGQKLSSAQRVNWRVMLGEIESWSGYFSFQEYKVPLTAEGGFHSELGFLPQTHPFRSAMDYQNYLKRLQAIPRFIQQNMAWMQKGITEGRSVPQAVLEGYEASIAAFVVAPEQSVFFEPFKQKSGAVDESEFAKFQVQALDIIGSSVIPAYKNYLTFFREQYYPHCRQTLACRSLPDGESYYRFLIGRYVTRQMDPEEIHALGQQEVARIRAEMEAVIQKVGFKGDFPEFLTFLRTDPQFYVTSGDQLLKEAAYIAKKMEGQLPRLFGHLPRQPFTVAPVPDQIAPKYTGGRYVPSGGPTQPGTYWVNTYALETRPLYVLEALTFHEAVPGHHLQGALSQELQDVPAFRKYVYHSAFGEGWALYAEYLGVEAGFYQDPYSQFGRLTYEMWRACRLVVDTGIHWKGWSRDQVLAFMAQNTALSLHEIETETDRYISWPAQALSYKIGELEIKRLRGLAEKALGRRFDLREFHDAVLENGSIPLELLTLQIETFIQNHTASP